MIGSSQQFVVALHGATELEKATSDLGHPTSDLDALTPIYSLEFLHTDAFAGVRYAFCRDPGRTRGMIPARPS
jgi:hypothetical protein